MIYTLAFSLHAQEPGITIKGKVEDAISKEALPYVNIVLLKSNRGTISNSDGNFTFEHIQLGDSIQFSFIGYQSQIHLVDEKSSLNIQLIPETNLLNTVTLFYKTDFLNELIQRCRKTKNRNPKTAKTYFSLSSYYKNQRVEFLEAYYNGEFRGHDVHDLKLKNGRIALQKKDNRLFISSETSVVLCLYNSFKKDDYFPRNPLEMGSRKLDKLFNLNLNEKYADPQGRVVYVIGCEPKSEDKMAFSSTLWIDSSSAQLIRLKLDIKDAKIHPFSTLSKSSILDAVDLSIRKSFFSEEGETFLKTMDFDYQLHYKTKEGKSYDVKSEAVLYAYNFNESFTLPYFEFTEGTYEDYRNVNASPYNEDFWRLSQEFTLNDDPRKNNMFLEKSKALTNRSLFSTNSLFKTGFFETPYVFWSEKRVAFKPAEGISPQNKKQILPKNRYNLGVQIYLDYNVFKDSIYYNIATVFDPYKTYSFLPESPLTAAFINIYFDLMEIEKRKLERQLKDPKTQGNQIKDIYENCKKDCEIISWDYFKQVQRGTNWTALKYWNERVKNNLGIDNIQLYQLSDPMETENN